MNDPKEEGEQRVRKGEERNGDPLPSELKVEGLISRVNLGMEGNRENAWQQPHSIGSISPGGSLHPTHLYGLLRNHPPNQCPLPQQTTHFCISIMWSKREKLILFECFICKWGYFPANKLFIQKLYNNSVLLVSSFPSFFKWTHAM